MSTDIAGLAAPGAAQRPVSMASSTSSGSSNNNPFFDDMAYLDQVVEVEKTKKPRPKWGSRRKAESMTKGGSKQLSAAVVAKVRPQRSMANIGTRAASPPPTFIPYRPPSPPAFIPYRAPVSPQFIPYRPPSPNKSSQALVASTQRPISPSPSISPLPGPVAVFPSGPVVVTLSSDSEPDGPSLFDDLELLDTAMTVAAEPKARTRSKGKKKERKNTHLNAGMSKLNFLMSSASLGRSSRSDDSGSTPRASLSISASGSSGSSFTFTRSRRSSFSSYSTNTMTSFNTITTNANTVSSDPTPKAKASPPLHSLPTVESTPQPQPLVFAGTSMSSSTSTTPHSPFDSSPSKPSAQLPDTASRTAPNLTPSRPTPAPPVLTSPGATPVPVVPRRTPGPLISTAHRSSPFQGSSSPPPFSSYLCSSPPSGTAQLPSSPTSISHNTTPTPMASERRGDGRRYSKGWYGFSPQQRASRVGGNTNEVEEQGNVVSSLAPPTHSRRQARGSMAESPCLSIIGTFPVPPDIQMDGNRQLGPGSEDHLVAQLAAVAEVGARDQNRGQSAAFLDEYMAFVSTPSPPSANDGARSPLQVHVPEPEVGSKSEKHREEREHSVASQGTTASPTLLTPDPSKSTLSVPWARPLSIKRNTSSNSLTVESESARPESVMLPPNLDETSPTPNKHRFEEYEPTDQIDPLAPAPLSPVRPQQTPPPTSFPPPPPIPGDGYEHPPVRRQTFGYQPTLPGMPLEKSPARATRQDSNGSVLSSSASGLSSSFGASPMRVDRQGSAASVASSTSVYSQGTHMTRKDSVGSLAFGPSPTRAAFPHLQGVDTVPLNIRRREGLGSRSVSGPGRARTAAGTTAPLNIARARTTSTTSSDALGYSSSPGYERGMVSNLESLPRFNMSGHDVSRLRTTSGGPTRLAPPRPRRRSSMTTPSNLSSAVNSRVPSPSPSNPGSAPHTPGLASSVQTHAQASSQDHSSSYGQSLSYGHSGSYAHSSASHEQSYSSSSHGHGSYGHSSYSQANGSSYSSHSYTAAHAPTSFASPLSLTSTLPRSNGHSHKASSSSVSVPPSGWYSSHGLPTSPRSTGRRPSISTMTPLATSPRRGVPF